MRLLFRLMPMLLSVAALHAAQAQDAKTEFFKTIQAEVDQARADKVDVLAPKTFERAMSALQDAQKDFDKGRKHERINEEINECNQTLKQAQQFAATSRKELFSVISARDDALKAEAPKYAPDAWHDADERFHDAVEKIEHKDIDGAHRKGAEAEVLLRDTELAAIKDKLLGEARALIAQADKSKTEDFAPRTLDAARQYLAQADQEITRNRYDSTVPKQLIAKAVYEAKHALYLRNQIDALLQKSNIKQHGPEQTMLDWEEPIRKLAVELNVDASFDQGYQKPMHDLYEKAAQLQRDLATQQQEVRDRDDQIALLNTEIKQLETRLGGESQERLELQKQLSVQERLRDNIAKIEGMFTVDEGRVYRQHNDLILSLPAISFRVGKSTIEPDDFPVLAKVGDAIKLFPDASLIVEGHTDSQGNDSAMLLLSQDRADAVRQYLITNLGVAPEKVSAVGYGKARPIASNENETGRARNRRIDIVMKIIGN
ncbi:MAG TPA: OmpA family protein [Steroidobacteraceae bacterium]|nr:OmpA family protein [Steroidobacteraceae bacterium]